MLDSGCDVQVRLSPEPSNRYDSQAIAFECQLSGKSKWEKIGYVVREALTNVHNTLQKREIQSVKFSWIKYITTWTRSGPGFYAGVEISKEGSWSEEVMRSSST